MRRKLRRAHFRLLFRRQRGKLHRPAVGADGGLLRLLEAAGCGRGADRARRAQASAVVVRIDDAGAGNAAVAAIRIGWLLLLRTGRSVPIDDRGRSGRTAVDRARSVRSGDRAARKSAGNGLLSAGPFPGANARGGSSPAAG